MHHDRTFLRCVREDRMSEPTVMHRIQRFFRTPKGLLTIVLAVILAIAVPFEGTALVLPGLAAAVLAATIVDAPILRLREKKWVVPSGAWLTAAIVAMVLSPHEPWWVPAVTAVVGIVSKYVARVGNANVFNPAALALLITFFPLHTGQSWWGALPELPIYAIAALLIGGVFITNRVNKMPAALCFLGIYYLLVTIVAFAGNPERVAELYRAPDLHAAVFFALIMVTDPPTSPPKARDQLIYGAIVAVVAFTIFETIGAVYYLVGGLVVANVWDAWRRWRVRAKRERERAERAANRHAAVVSAP